MKSENVLTPPHCSETLMTYVVAILLLSMLAGPWINDIPPLWSRWSDGSATNQTLFTFLLFKSIFVAVQLCFVYYAVFRPMTLHAREQRQHYAFVQKIQNELAELRTQLAAIAPLEGRR